MDKTFLIIDDDPAVCKMLELLIRSNGLGRVVCVLHSGESAVGEVLFYQPDIVLLDMMLPVTSGVTIVRQLVSAGFAGKCVMLSQISDRMPEDLVDRGIAAPSGMTIREIYREREPLYARYADLIVASRDRFLPAAVGD